MSRSMRLGDDLKRKLWQLQVAIFIDYKRLKKRKCGQNLWSHQNLSIRLSNPPHIAVWIAYVAGLVIKTTVCTPPNFAICSPAQSKTTAIKRMCKCCIAYQFRAAFFVYPRSWRRFKTSSLFNDQFHRSVIDFASHDIMTHLTSAN